MNRVSVPLPPLGVTFDDGFGAIVLYVVNHEKFGVQNLTNVLKGGGAKCCRRACSLNRSAG